MDLPDLLKLWPAALAAVSAVLGHKLAQARNSWRLDALEERVSRHEVQTEKHFEEYAADVAALKVDAAEAKVNFGILQTTLTQMRDALIRIEGRLDGKQDK